MRVAGTICAPVTTVTVVDADFVGSAIDVAVTVDCGGAGMVVGAVYSPVGEMLLPAEDVQVTPEFALPVTFALNCCVWFAPTVGEVGEIETEIGPEGDEPPPLPPDPPPHPKANAINTARQQVYPQRMIASP